MNQRVVYGKDREAIVPYDVAIWWHLAFDVEKSIFNPTYIPGIYRKKYSSCKERALLKHSQIATLEGSG